MVWYGSVDVCWENVVCFDSIFNRPLYAELSTFDEENVIKKFLSYKNLQQFAIKNEKSTEQGNKGDLVIAHHPLF